jgi:hypothetical protein
VPEINEQWIREQMQEAKVKVGVGNALLKLIAAWEPLKISGPQQKEVLALFSKLALGYAVTPEVPNEVWIDAQPGAITVGDQVRVKLDAYEGSTGSMHNGRRGKVVGIRYGDIIFKSNDDKEPVLDGSHYSPHQLQKRVQ